MEPRIDEEMFKDEYVDPDLPVSHRPQTTDWKVKTKRKAKRYTEEFVDKSKNITHSVRESYQNNRQSVNQFLIVFAQVLFIIILFQNVQMAEFQILFWSFSSPKIIVFLALLAIGIGFGYWLKGRFAAKVKRDEQSVNSALH